METLVTVLRVTMERSTVAVRLEHTSHVPCTLKIINRKNLVINQRINFSRFSIRRQGRAHQPRALHIADYHHEEPGDKSKPLFASG
jgi:hypothetical protein